MHLGRSMAIVGTAVVVIGAIVYGFAPKALPVDVARVSRGPMKVTVEEEGRTRVKERFVLSAPVAGFMRRVTADVGEIPCAGDRLSSSWSARGRTCSIPGNMLPPWPA